MRQSVFGIFQCFTFSCLIFLSISSCKNNTEQQAVLTEEQLLALKHQKNNLNKGLIAPNSHEKWSYLMMDILNITDLHDLGKRPSTIMNEVLFEYELNRIQLHHILLDHSKTDILINLCKPAFKQYWNALDYHEQINIWLIVNHCKKYLNTFSIEKEKAYWQDVKELTIHLQYASMKGEYYFNRNGHDDFFEKNYFKPYPHLPPFDFTNPYRRAEGFIYRRIDGGVSPIKLQKLIDQLLILMELPQDGTYSKKYDSGETKEIARFKNGTPHGTWVYFPLLTFEEKAMVSNYGDATTYNNGVKIDLEIKFETNNKSFIQSVSEYKKGRINKITRFTYLKINDTTNKLVQVQEASLSSKKVVSARTIKELKSSKAHVIPLDQGFENHVLYQ